MTETEFTFAPLTPERWTDLESLFGPQGACGGCWCMWWRIPRAEYDRQRGEGNRQALRSVVESGVVPGLLAYAGGQAVGWCALQPRADYPALARSRVLKAVDEAPVWSVTCFYVAKGFRRKGLTVRLLNAAAEYARAQGAAILEGYPKDPPAGASQPDAFVFTGLMGAFLQAGFTEAARRSPTRPIMRKTLD